jgi:putative tricarboxylic transport membrane protein
VILGPLMEAQFRRTLIVSDGDFTAFVERPLSIGLLLAAALILLVPRLLPLLRRPPG